MLIIIKKNIRKDCYYHKNAETEKPPFEKPHTNTPDGNLKEKKIQFFKSN